MSDFTGATEATVRVLSDSGSFTDPIRVSWAGGRFALQDPVAGENNTQPDTQGLWMIPGIVDAHVHIDHHLFMPEDDARLENRAELTRAALARTLATGVTSARDAGGLDPAFLESLPRGTAPRFQTSIAMIHRATAEAEGGVARVAERALAAGARWVKLVATAGVAAPPNTDLAPVFTAAEMHAAVAAAQQVGAGVMVHAWGGQAIDDAIEAGATSIEHGIYLTEDQARRAADRGLVFVPTLRIYRLVQQMIERGELPAAFRARVDGACETHPGAVRIARDAGLPVALGSDYGVTAQHGTNRLEFDALVAAGLSPAEALIAATRTGAELLRRVAVEPERLPSGRIADGEIADAAIFDRDPREPGVFTDPARLVAVILDGQLIELPTLRHTSLSTEPSNTSAAPASQR